MSKYGTYPLPYGFRRLTNFTSGAFWVEWSWLVL
jgi:hypothetical protein